MPPSVRSFPYPTPPPPAAPSSAPSRHHVERFCLPYRATFPVPPPRHRGTITAPISSEPTLYRTLLSTTTNHTHHRPPPSVPARPLQSALPCTVSPTQQRGAGHQASAGLPSSHDQVQPGYPAPISHHPYAARSRRAYIGEIEAKDGLPSADRNNKATLLLTGPFRTAKSSAKDLTPLVLKLQYAKYHDALRAPWRNRLLRR